MIGVIDVGHDDIGKAVAKLECQYGRLSGDANQVCQRAP